MNLVSCDRCGVVLDKSKLVFLDIYDPNSGEIMEEVAIWNGREYVSFVPCPVCGEPIKEKE